MLGFEEGITIVDESFVKASVHRLFYEIDNDKEALKHINGVLANEIGTLAPSARSDH